MRNQPFRFFLGFFFFFLHVSCFSATNPHSGQPWAGFLEACGETPDAILTAVRDRIRFSPYAGFIQGPTGTLLAGHGNALDTAEMLQQALRDKGFETRLAYGALSEDQISQLLHPVFPVASFPDEVQEKLPGSSTADPVADEGVRRNAISHVWVQVKTEETWKNLDPFLGTGASELSLVPLERTEEAPLEEQRRKLKIEVFTRTGCSELVSCLVFERSLAELAGQNVAFFHVGTASTSRGIRAGLARLRPALAFNDEVFPGEPYGGIRDEAEPVPAATRLHGIFDQTEESTDPGSGLGPDSGQSSGQSSGQGSGPGSGGVEPVVNEVFLEATLFGADLPEKRQRRYLFIDSPEGLDRLDELTSFAVVFGEPSRQQIGGWLQAAASSTRELKDLSLPQTGTITSDQQAGAEHILLATARLSGALANWVGRSLERLQHEVDLAFGTVTIQDDARIICVSIGGNPCTISTDLMFDAGPCLPLPGAKPAGVYAAAGAGGFLAGRLEGACLATLQKKLPEKGSKRTSVEAVFQAAAEQNVKIVVLLPTGGEFLGEGNAGNPEVLSELNKVSLSSVGRRILAESFTPEKAFLIPEKPVEVNGKKISAWYEIDRLTGRWVAVSAEGRHESMLEYQNLKRINDLAVTWTCGFWSGFCNTLNAFAIAALEVVDGDPDQSWGDIRAHCLDAAKKIDLQNNFMQGLGDVAGILILGSSDPITARILGQAGLMTGQVAGIGFLMKQMPR